MNDIVLPYIQIDRLHTHDIIGSSNRGSVNVCGLHLHRPNTPPPPPASNYHHRRHHCDHLPTLQVERHLGAGPLLGLQHAEAEGPEHVVVHAHASIGPQVLQAGTRDT